MTPFDKYNYFRLSIIDDNLLSTLGNFNHYFLANNEDFKVASKEELDFGLICDNPELDYIGEFKFLIYEPRTNPGKTVFFSNLRDGWYTAVYNYARLFKKDIYHIGLTVERQLQRYPAYFFRKLFHDKAEMNERIVQLVKEDKWVFYENSQEARPLSIEDIQNYSSRKHTDKLNNEIILDYLDRAGFDLRDTSFFLTDKPVYYCKWK